MSDVGEWWSRIRLELLELKPYDYPTTPILGESERTMEKYGVELDDEKTKTASADNPVCPDCGAELMRKMSLKGDMCPNCGTKPFEKRKKEDE